VTSNSQGRAWLVRFRNADVLGTRLLSARPTLGATGTCDSTADSGDILTVRRLPDDENTANDGANNRQEYWRRCALAVICSRRPAALLGCCQTARTDVTFARYKRRCGADGCRRPGTGGGA